MSEKKVAVFIFAYYWPQHIFSAYIFGEPAIMGEFQYRPREAFCGLFWDN